MILTKVLEGLMLLSVIAVIVLIYTI